jgi:hypothetical protein
MPKSSYLAVPGFLGLAGKKNDGARVRVVQLGKERVLLLREMARLLRDENLRTHT